MDWLNMGANIEIFLFARPNFQKKTANSIVIMVIMRILPIRAPCAAAQRLTSAAALPLSSNSH